MLFADNDPRLQERQLRERVRAAASERPLAFVAETVAGEALADLAREAVAAGTAWVLVNREAPYLDDLRRVAARLAIFMVSTDQLEIGRIQARQIRALLPNGGDVLYVQGPADTSAAQDRLRGARDGLRGARLGLSVVNGDWTETSGERAAGAWLEASPGGRVALVAAQNDSMALGARRAFAAAGRDTGVRFTGCDGLAAGGRRLVDSGVLAATIISPTTTGPALERLSEWLQSGRLPPREVLLEPNSYPDELLVRS